MSKTLHFGTTRCEIGPGWVVTTLPSGVEVFAYPQHSDEQRETARRLGYGDDLDALTRDHDPMHAAVAQFLGLPASVALRQASGEPVSAELAALEEDAVLAMQRLCRALGRFPWQT